MLLPHLFSDDLSFESTSMKEKGLLPADSSLCQKCYLRTLVKVGRTHSCVWMLSLITSRRGGNQRRLRRKFTDGMDGSLSGFCVDSKCVSIERIAGERDRDSSKSPVVASGCDAHPSVSVSAPLISWRTFFPWKMFLTHYTYFTSTLWAIRCENKVHCYCPVEGRRDDKLMQWKKEESREADKRSWWKWMCFHQKKDYRYDHRREQEHLGKERQVWCSSRLWVRDVWPGLKPDHHFRSVVIILILVTLSKRRSSRHVRFFLLTSSPVFTRLFQDKCHQLSQARERQHDTPKASLMTWSPTHFPSSVQDI